ncbi:MAG: hypothetical protein CMB59_06095 [Euryarchaeota archaeon]|nr:hypothetical protein [Euryarchaeota archaeon]|tara:strand:+ start:320 stop:553 length:234 start_codon:yes stop_codon:yes gene_type:complete
MVGNASDELFSGFWPIMRRFLFAFLPLWVFLIAYSADINVIISAILAGASVSLVAIYEKKKILSENEKQSDGNKVIK